MSTTLAVIPEELQSKIPSEMRKCCVSTCKSWSAGAVTLHPIPTRPVQLQIKWYSFIRKTRGANWTPKDDHNVPLVCNLHFSANSFLPSSNRLKPTACPKYEVSQIEERNSLRRHRYEKQHNYLCRPKQARKADGIPSERPTAAAVSVLQASSGKGYLPIVPKTDEGRGGSKTIINIVTIPQLIVPTPVMPANQLSLVQNNLNTESEKTQAGPIHSPDGRLQDAVCDEVTKLTTSQSTLDCSATIEGDVDCSAAVPLDVSSLINFNTESCCLCRKSMPLSSNMDSCESLEYVNMVKKMLNIKDSSTGGTSEGTDLLCRRCVSKLRPVRVALLNLLEAQREYEAQRNLVLQDIARSFCEQIRTTLAIPKRVASAAALHTLLAERWASDLSPPFLRHPWDSSKLDNLVQRLNDRSRTSTSDANMRKKWAQRRNELSRTKIANRRSKIRRKELPTSCPICNMQLQFSSLPNHMKTHTGELKHQCSFCSKKFLRKSNLKNHLKTHIVGDSSFGKSNRAYICHKGCGKSLYSGKRYVRHLILSHPNQMMNASGTIETVKFYDCDAEGCNISISDLKDFQAHLRTHAVESQVCELCLKHFASPENLKNHRAVHNQVYVNICEFCCETYLLEEEDHHQFFHKISVDPKMTKFRCQQCSKIFLSDWDLIQHVGVHRSSVAGNPEFPKGGSQNHTCQTCGDVFRSEGKLSVHAYMHTNPDGFRCDGCHQSYSSPNKLWSHKQKYNCLNGERNNMAKPVVNRTSREPSLAAIKRRKFPLRQCVRRNQQPHMKTQRQKFRVKQPRHLNCNHCSYTSKGSLYLYRRHLLIHHPDIYVNGKEHFCKVCWKNFATAEELYVHQNTIHNRYKCKVCGKVMGNIIRLQEHQRVHTGEKPYQCGYCQKLFSFEANLKEHEFRHTGHRPHNCQVCSKGFFRKKLLLSHMQKHHKVVTAS